MNRLAGRLFMAIAPLWAVASCGRSPGPSPPPEIVMSCPASIVVSGVTGQARPVTFSQPATASGVPPIVTLCAPQSGASFPLGSSTVLCTATDASGQRAFCSFTVTLQPSILQATKFLAFGDSVTEGQNGRTSSLRPQVVDLPNAYPTKLESLLNQEYPSQNIRVINKGRGGRNVETGLQDLPLDLAAERPDALLLLDGYNNLLANCPASSALSMSCTAAIDVVVRTLASDIQVAKAAGVRYVFVSTLTPPGPVTGLFNRQIASDAIVQLNARILPMALAEGAEPVNLHPLFVGRESELIDADGLHLKPAGNEVLAQAFLQAITRVLQRTHSLK